MSRTSDRQLKVLARCDAASAKIQAEKTYRPVTDAERVESAKRHIRRLINHWDIYKDDPQAIYDEVSGAWMYLDSRLFASDDD